MENFIVFSVVVIAIISMIIIAYLSWKAIQYIAYHLSHAVFKGIYDARDGVSVSQEKAAPPKEESVKSIVPP